MRFPMAAIRATLYALIAFNIVFAHTEIFATIAACTEEQYEKLWWWISF